MKMSVMAQNVLVGLKTDELNIASNLGQDNPEIPYYDELQVLGLITTERTVEGGIVWIKLTNKGRLVKNQKR